MGISSRLCVCLYMPFHVRKIPLNNFIFVANKFQCHAISCHTMSAAEAASATQQNKTKTKKESTHHKVREKFVKYMHVLLVCGMLEKWNSKKRKETKWNEEKRKRQTSWCNKTKHIFFACNRLENNKQCAIVKMPCNTNKPITGQSGDFFT